MLRRTFLAAATITAFGLPAMAQDADIIDTAANADGFSTLIAAIDAAGMTETLKGEGPFTVFAPTDDEFAALGDGVVEELLKPENKDALAAVLSFHVLPGKVMYDDITESGEVTTIAGVPLKVTVDGDTKMIGNAVIIGSDIEASNGVIHVPDRVITPE